MIDMTHMLCCILINYLVVTGKCSARTELDEMWQIQSRNCYLSIAEFRDQQTAKNVEIFEWILCGSLNYYVLPVPGYTVTTVFRPQF